MILINLIECILYLKMHITLDSVILLLKIYPNKIAMNMWKTYLRRFLYRNKNKNNVNIQWKRFS